MLQEQLPPGYEIIVDETGFFVKKDGHYLVLPSGRKRHWIKGLGKEKAVYRWCWENYRREEQIPFEDYACIVQIITALPNWEAVFLNDSKEDLYFTKPIACWAHIEIFDGPYKRTHVVGMVANEEPDDNDILLTLIGKDHLSFLGYTYPGDETNWKQKAYDCIKRRPGVSGYSREDVLLWEQEEAEQREQSLNPQQSD